MQIIIDNKIADIKLENEKTSGEIIMAILKWMNGQGFSAHDIRLNGQNILANIFWRDIEIDQIQEIAFLTHETGPYRKESLEKIFAWTITVAERFTEINKGQKPESLLPLIGQYPEYEFAFLTEYDPEKIKILDISLRRSLEDHIAQLVDDGGKFTSYDLPEFEKTIQNINLILQERILEFENPEQELRRTLHVLPSILKEMTDVGTLAQLGKVKEAYGRILVFIEFVSKINRLLFLMRDQELEEWSQRAETYLKNLEEAMTHGDSIGIGDVLEYELTPVLEELIQLRGGAVK